MSFACPVRRGSWVSSLQEFTWSRSQAHLLGAAGEGGGVREVMRGARGSTVCQPLSNGPACRRRFLKFSWF
jgi:hypothetical protein